MYGVNWVSAFGRLMDDPIRVKFKNTSGVAFRINMSDDKTPNEIWCFSLNVSAQHTETFHVKKGQYCTFHGAIFAPPTHLRSQVSKKWILAIEGRIYAAMDCVNFRAGQDARHLAPCIVTGMVTPGIRYGKSHAGFEYMWFTMHNERAIPLKDREPMICQQTLATRAWATPRNQQIIVPGAVIICRGHIGISKSGIMNVMSSAVESLGVVQNKLVQRYAERPATFPPGFDPTRAEEIDKLKFRSKCREEKELAERNRDEPQVEHEAANPIFIDTTDPSVRP